jgi:hypothetical protein
MRDSVKVGIELTSDAIADSNENSDGRDHLPTVDDRRIELLTRVVGKGNFSCCC